MEEVLMPLLFKVEGEEEWGEVTELKALEAFREGRIPSSTLFKRGQTGEWRRLATLVAWNGKECPFLDFSQPMERGGMRTKLREERGSWRQADGEAPLSAAGAALAADFAREEQRIGEFMDIVMERLRFIEGKFDHHQTAIAAIDAFMKRVGTLEMMVSNLANKCKMVESSVEQLTKICFFGKREPVNNMDDGRNFHETREMMQKVYAEMMKKYEDLDVYKTEVVAVHERNTLMAKQLQLLESKCMQMEAVGSIVKKYKEVKVESEDYKDVKIEPEDVKMEPPEEPHFETTYPVGHLGTSHSGEPVVTNGAAAAASSTAYLTPAATPLSAANAAPRRPAAAPIYATPAATMPIPPEPAEPPRYAAYAATLRPPVMMSPPAALAAPYVPAAAAAASWLHPDPIIGERMDSLLSGRANPRDRRDKRADRADVQQLSRRVMKTMLNDVYASRTLTQYMGHPYFMCYCGGVIDDGVSFIAHISTTKHETVRKMPIYQSDIDFWLKVVMAICEDPNVSKHQLDAFQSH